MGWKRTYRWGVGYWSLTLESDLSSLATELGGLNERTQLLESELLSHQNEANNWKGKTQFLETELSTQLE